MNLQCRRCRHRFDSEREGRTGIYLEWPGPGHPLQRQLVVQLCGECTDGLRAWIGLPPPAVDPAAVPGVRIPAPPPSQFYEE